MTDELLERVRASDPLPAGSSAPPFETVVAHVRAHASSQPPSTSRHRGRGRLRWLVPSLSAVVAVAVLVVAVTDLRTDHHATVRPAHHTPTAPPRAPRSGMPGLVLVAGAGFPSASRGLISVQQCLGCRGDVQTQPGERYWLASTNDGGREWTLSRQDYYVQAPLFVGRDGWAGGLRASDQAAEYYVTHDGGRSWKVAPAAAPNEGGSLVSLSGDEVWATGLSNHVAILHAPVTGSRLTATAAQPIRGDSTGVGVVAAGPGTAYAWNGDARDQTFVTRDDGRSWQRIAPPCPVADGPGALDAAFGETVWAECYSVHDPGVTLLTWSSNGGRSWQQLRSLHRASVQVDPVSPSVAWALARTGRFDQTARILRTTDAGRSWRTVWTTQIRRDAPRRSHFPKAVAEANVPLLITQSPSAASFVTLLTRGHEYGHARFTNLVVYRTSDGGRSWITNVVPLAPR